MLEKFTSQEILSLWKIVKVKKLLLLPFIFGGFSPAP